MKLKKEVFLTIALLIPALYGVANAVLWHQNGGFYYGHTDLFFWMTSIFALMVILVLPRTVAIMAGGERTSPEAEGADPEETSDSGDTFPCQRPK